MENSLRNSLLTALLALVFGFLGAAAWSYSGLADNRTRTYLLDNPAILEDMAMALQDEQARDRISQAGEDIYAAFPGAVMGNPAGSKTLVEFTDYNCPYCEASLADVNRLIAEDPDLKVVMREWPIFEGSDGAARMALAAGMQGKYTAFHEAMFKLGPTTPEAIEAAAIEAGLDIERARSDAASDAVSIEIAKNLSLAQALGFSGTPAWVAGDKAIGGMVGYDALKEALDEIGS
ncbi:DsbA family protein [Erythrobacter insulae]|uniref:DsbA family protein n=1 Tax=Erythrobacter insulae TaxID=2584124 RepID=A0A547PAW7_9SPHN|nr:DsbA family protein [Erythrobacter insulae]TRD11292.1 DsbA family protein [Erythrobacter insulae]